MLSNFVYTNKVILFLVSQSLSLSHHLFIHPSVCISICNSLTNKVPRQLGTHTHTCIYLHMYACIIYINNNIYLSNHSDNTLHVLLWWGFLVGVFSVFVFFYSAYQAVVPSGQLGTRRFACVVIEDCLS